MQSTMVSLRRSKRLRQCSGESSVLAPIPSLCDNETAPQDSTPAKSDSVPPVPSNDVNQPEGAYLHLAMKLRENENSYSPSMKGDEARVCIAELEERVRHFEETTARKETENEVLRRRVQECESKLNDVLIEAGQPRHKAEVCERKLKEQEALHKEKAIHMHEVLRQLAEPNTNLSRGLDVAQAHTGKLTSALTEALANCDSIMVLLDKRKEEYDKDRIFLNAKLGSLTETVSKLEVEAVSVKVQHEKEVGLLRREFESKLNDAMHGVELERAALHNAEKRHNTELELLRKEHATQLEEILNRTKLDKAKTAERKSEDRKYTMDETEDDNFCWGYEDGMRKMPHRSGRTEEQDLKGDLSAALSLSRVRTSLRTHEILRSYHIRSLSRAERDVHP